MRYSRIHVKLSDGAITGDQEWGFDPDLMERIPTQGDDFLVARPRRLFNQAAFVSVW